MEPSEDSNKEPTHNEHPAMSDDSIENKAYSVTGHRYHEAEPVRQKGGENDSTYTTDEATNVVD